MNSIVPIVNDLAEALAFLRAGIVSREEVAQYVEDANLSLSGADIIALVQHNVWNTDKARKFLNLPDFKE